MVRVATVEPETLAPFEAQPIPCRPQQTSSPYWHALGGPTEIAPGHMANQR